MIPVLIVPVISRLDLMARMLASIDQPVDRLVVVDNTPAHDLELGLVPFPTRSIGIIRPLINLGFPGSLNAGISQTPFADWWMWASVDLTFGPGDLAEIIDWIEASPEPVCVTGSRNDDRLLRAAYGAVNQAAIAAVGLFDEWTTFPIYFDDDDWERRCRVGGVEWVEYDGTIGHERSSTIKDPELATRNRATFLDNEDAYIAKWGGRPGAERFASPWNLGVPLDYIRPDLPGRARRAW